jgi:hypothetical protein
MECGGDSLIPTLAGWVRPGCSCSEIYNGHIIFSSGGFGCIVRHAMLLGNRRNDQGVFLNRCRRMKEIREDGVWWRFLDPNVSWVGSTRMLVWGLRGQEVAL